MRIPATRKLAATATAIVLMATPSAALAQGAGDDQYADPLGNSPSEPSDGGGGGGGNSGSGNQGNSGSGTGQTGSGTAGTTSGQEAPTGSAAQQPAPSAQTAPGLPRTGLDAWLVAVAGAALLGSGVLLRRTAGAFRS